MTCNLCQRASEVAVDFAIALLGPISHPLVLSVVHLQASRHIKCGQVLSSVKSRSLPATAIKVSKSLITRERSFKTKLLQLQIRVNNKVLLVLHFVSALGFQ